MTTTDISSTLSGFFKTGRTTESMRLAQQHPVADAAL
jgi:hypothetical protein